VGFPQNANVKPPREFQVSLSYYCSNGWEIHSRPDFQKRRNCYFTIIRMVPASLCSFLTPFNYPGKPGPPPGFLLFAPCLSAHGVPQYGPKTYCKAYLAQKSGLIILVAEFFEGEVSVKPPNILVGKLSVKGRSTRPYIGREKIQ
jgi:hypothetical protein